MKSQNNTTLIIILSVIVLLCLGGAYAAKTWIEGSNAAKCVVNLSSIKKGAQSYHCMNNNPGPVSLEELIEGGYYDGEKCPSGGTYILRSLHKGDTEVSCTYDDPRHKLDY